MLVRGGGGNEKAPGVVLPLLRSVIREAITLLNDVPFVGVVLVIFLLESEGSFFCSLYSCIEEGGCCGVGVIFSVATSCTISSASWYLG